MAHEPEAIGLTRPETPEGRRSALVAGVALDLAHARTPTDVNGRLVVRAVDALEADRAALLRLQDDEVSVVAAHDRDGDGARAVPAGPHRLEAEPLLLRACTSRAPAAGGALPPEVKGRSLVLPLVFDAHVIGFLTVQRRHDVPFDEGDVAMLQLIGNVAVVTLRNARFYAEATGAKQAMADLLNTVMHELRAPLAIVGGYMSMIREGVFGPAPPALRAPLTTIENKLHEAQRMVDELLTASRLENGELPFNIVAVDLCDAARRAADRAGPRATLLGAHVDVLAPDTAWGRADAGHVDRILDNLVNNALLHAGPSPHVTITAVGGEQPALHVSDTGDGVTELDRPHIFERFFRGGDAAGGTGLGLYISRRLAGRWGGSLDLDPSTDGGARFVLSLPPAA